MKNIIPHLWFDKEAKEAAEFYTSIFPNSKVTNVTTILDTPSGDSDFVSFTLWGVPFMAISAGPVFKFNPSISFMVNFDPSKEKSAKVDINTVWNALAEGGKVLMPLQEYPFSKRFGWIQDKYGLSWQLILTDPKGEKRPQILPSLLFTGGVYGKAEEAIKFYTSVFKASTIGTVAKYGPNQEPNKEGTVMFSEMKLWDTWMTVMDGGGQHNFAFNEAISFLVHCDTQEEIDYYWERLSAVPELEQCGWLKDKFGVSWQITPTMMDEMMRTKDKEKLARVTKAFLQMKKFNLAKLERAAEGR